MKNEDLTEINNHLVIAWNKFVELKTTHPDHLRYFRDAIHSAQQVLMWKELQNIQSENYPSYL